jgi:hypothetical protein
MPLFPFLLFSSHPPPNQNKSSGKRTFKVIIKTQHRVGNGKGIALGRALKLGQGDWLMEK